MAARRKDHRTNVAQTEEKPDPRVVNASSDYIFSAVMFLIAVLVPWYFELPLVFDIYSPDFNPLIFVPVVFAGVGVVMLTRTVLGVVRAGKFGNATLSPTAARRGEIFRPVMLTKVDIDTTGDFVLTLKCIRRAGGGDEYEGGSSSDKVLWKHAEICPAATRSRIGVAAVFQIPHDAQPTRGPDKGTNYGNVRWVLTVTAPVRGVNFRQDFNVTVR